MDLKGDVFTGAVLPCASTVCVLTLSGTDAKIEHVMTDFMRARRSGNVISSMGGRVVEGKLNPSHLRGAAKARRAEAESDGGGEAGSSASSRGGDGASSFGDDDERPAKKRAKPSAAGSGSRKPGKPAKRKPSAKARASKVKGAKPPRAGAGKRAG